MEKNLDVLKKELESINEIMSGIDDSFGEFDSEGINLIETIMNKRIPEDVSLNFLDSFNSAIVREYAIKYMGFALITKKVIKSLARYIGSEKCLEIMSGQGCLSKSLQDEGVDIIATDNYSWNGRLNMSDTWTNIEKIDCLDAIKKYGKDVSYILCSWIPYNNPIGYEALKLMNEINPECKMIVIGEGYGGCTADDSFFENLKEIYVEEEFISSFRSWSGIHDYISVVQFEK